MSEDYPLMTLTLVNKLNFDGMTEYGDYLLLGAAPEINDIDYHTKSCLHHLACITNSLTEHDKPIPP